MSLFLFLLFLQSPSYADDTILVTATRSGTARSDLPFSSERVSGEQWERRGSRVESVLQTVPGLSFSAAGGPGQTRSVFMRGARGEDTLVLIDGIPVNDPLSPSRAFDFSQIPTAEIESIEVLKGPQSVLYGSDAMGGVVQIFTRGDGPLRARLERGSYVTVRDRISYRGFHAGLESTEGFSAADKADGNTEKDAHRAWNVGGKREFALSDNTVLKVQGLYHRARTETDSHGGRGGDSTGTLTRNSQLIFRSEAFHVSEGGYEWTTAASHFTRNRDDNTFAPAYYRSRLWKAETNVRRRFGSHIPTLGAELFEEGGRTSEFAGRHKFHGGAAFVQDQFVSGRWQAVAGARMDFHSEHPRATTYRGGLGFWLIPDVLRIKSSAGTGFKAPSLYQTHSQFGSRALSPSRIVGGDAGLDFSYGPWAAEIAHYRNRFREMIDFNPATSRYFNLGRAETRGWEFALARSMGLFTLRNVFTTIHAVDRRAGDKLLRRPSTSGASELSYRKGDFVGGALRLRYVGRRVDIHPVLYGRQNMPAFMTVDADFFHRLSKDWKLVARGENLLDRHYQETSGFGTPGLSGYLGVEAEL
jgi:vitamin B12 transporter